jgi:hypothetical protein
MLPLNAIRYAATGGVPGALLSCHRYDEILPPCAIQSCHLNKSGLDCQMQRSATVGRLRSEHQAVGCGLTVIRQQSRIRVHFELSRALTECQADLSPTSEGIFVETRSERIQGFWNVLPRSRSRSTASWIALVIKSGSSIGTICELFQAMICSLVRDNAKRSFWSAL